MAALPILQASSSGIRRRTHSDPSAIDADLRSACADDITTEARDVLDEPVTRAVEIAQPSFDRRNIRGPHGDDRRTRHDAIGAQIEAHRYRRTVIVEDRVPCLRHRQSGECCSRDDEDEGYVWACHAAMVAPLEALATRCTVLVRRDQRALDPAKDT